jgi:putative sterol carrier protein
MAEFPSDAWWAEFVKAINASPGYAAAAADWEGAVSLVIEAEPDKSVPETLWGWLDLWHGACRSGAFVPEEEGAQAPYVVRAPYSRWKAVIRRELDPIKGMMQGKLKVTGDLPRLIREVNAASELVTLASSVPTEFVDER